MPYEDKKKAYHERSRQKFNRHKGKKVKKPKKKKKKRRFKSLKFQIA